MFLSKVAKTIQKRLVVNISIYELKALIGKAQKQLTNIQAQQDRERLLAKEDVFGDAARHEEIKAKADRWDTFSTIAGMEIKEFVCRAKKANKQDLSFKLLEARIKCLREFMEL